MTLKTQVEADLEQKQLAVEANRKASIIKFLRTAVWSKLPASVMLLVVLPKASEQFGVQFDAFQALTAILTLFNTVNLGIGPSAGIAFSKFAENPDPPAENKLLTSAIMSYAGSSLLTVLLIFLSLIYPSVGGLFGPSLISESALLTTGMLILALTVVVIAPQNIVMNTYWGTLQDYKNSQANIIGQFILVAVGIFSVFVLKSPLAFLAAFGMTLPIVHCFHGLRLFLKDRPTLRPTFKKIDWQESWQLFKDNALQSIGSLGFVLSRSVPVILIGTITGKSVEIGRAGIFLAWHGPISSLMGILVLSATPAIAAAVQSGDIAWAKKAIKKMAKILTIASVVAAVLVILIGPPISQMLFKDNYSMNHAEFAMVVAGAISTTFVVFANQMSMALKSFKENCIAGLIHGFMGLAIAVLLIPSLGLLGFAIGMVVGELTGGYFLTRLVQQYFRKQSQNAT
ncbi:MAG: lipopolysaccharide biosynthesis protein [Fimbriimonadaceae bacterium]